MLKVTTTFSDRRLCLRVSVLFQDSYLGERRPFPLRLDGDGLGSSLKDLIDVLLAELGPLVLLVHQRSVSSFLQKVLHLKFGELLHLKETQRLALEESPPGHPGPPGSPGSAHPVEASLAVYVLEDGLVQAQLQAGLVKHLPLVGVPGDQSVDLHGFALTNPVTPRLSLKGGNVPLISPGRVPTMHWGVTEVCDSSS